MIPAPISLAVIMAPALAMAILFIGVLFAWYEANK